VVVSVGVVTVSLRVVPTRLVVSVVRVAVRRVRAVSVWSSLSDEQPLIAPNHATALPRTARRVYSLVTDGRD